MSEIKPKKERRFLKTLGRVGEILVEQVLLKLGSSIIRKIGGKKTLPSILFLFLSFTLFAQFPNTGNKQRLGFQTTGDGLTWRGSISDTATIQPINNQSAWVILDTINLKFYSFDFTSNVWNLIGGSAAFTQPVDSLFFNVGVLTNNVDTAKMRWDSDLATVVLGLNDNVPNELGFKNFWLVKNQTGATITKGSLVYANGTVGASGRITVAKFIANGSIDAKYLLGITAHDLTNGEDGYVISFGKIRQVNTDTFAAGAILYPSPTVAGVWTDIEPIAPNIDMPIGFCINSHVNNGTIAIRVASGYKLSELHDVAISSPVNKASLYYSGGLWRDTTEALLVSDTSAFARDNQISGTSGQVAYFNSSNSVVSDTALRWSAANKSLGINMTTVPSGANLIIKNSQEPVRSTVVATQTFGADTTNWTRGTGWTFNGTQAVATAATGDLTYTPALTITSGNAYEITYTLSGYSAGTLTARIGNANYLLPTFNTTANVVLLLPTSASGGFRFTTSTFTGNVDNVSVVEISNPSPILFAGQDNGSNTLYNSLRMPNVTTLGFGGGGGNTTGTNNNFIGNIAGRNNTTGTNNNFLGTNAGSSTTIGSENNFFGSSAGLNNITGSNNNFFGTNSGINNTTGSNNNFYGINAGSSNTTANENNFFGVNSGFSNTIGSSNIFFGLSSGRSNTTGSNNIAIGRESLYNSVIADAPTGSNNIAIGRDVVDNIAGSAAGNVAIGNAVDLPTNNGSNQGVYQNVLFFTGASGTGTTIAAASKAGIKTNAPNRDLEVAGEVRITDLTTDAPTRLVGADADGDLGQVTLGAGLSLASSSLLADTNFLVTRFDTASMLTNYLRTGVAASTYLPLSGGTISGASSANNYTDALLNVNYQHIGFPTNQNVSGIITNINTNGENAFGILSEASTIYKNAIGVKGKANLLATGGNGVAYGILGEITANAGGGSASNSYAGYFNNTSTVSDGNHYGLFVNTASGGDYGIYQTGSGINYFGSNTSIGGTLGVTGATTLSAPLTVNSSAVFNEAATDSDFRVESEANAHMLFVDASTSRVGIGYASPTKTLDVNGEVRINTVTATPTSLLGKNGSNVVGEVTTVAQTGLMTRGETTATTGSPSATFTVTHGLGATPTSVLVTSAGLAGAEKIIFEVYTKSDTTFSVQAWNYDGTEASSKSVKIFWLAIK